MGTNYFCFEKNIGKKHIGKLSCKWTFLFHGYDEYGFKIKSYDEWKNFLLMNEAKICDECEDDIDINDFLALVENSLSQSNKRHVISEGAKGWYDKDGFLFLDNYFS